MCGAQLQTLMDAPQSNALAWPGTAELCSWPGAQLCAQKTSSCLFFEHNRLLSIQNSSTCSILISGTV